MEAHTSTEFMEWMVILQEEQRETTKQDCYLAQIAAEIRQFREMFSKHPKAIKVAEFLLNFGLSEVPKHKETDDPDKCLSIGSLMGDEAPTDLPMEVVEAGPDLMDDPKWARANERAKAMWAAFLPGVQENG